eukprot:1794505-Lingulodinium_polyedra.AAC.1
MPVMHTSTFGWIELIGAVSNLRKVYGAENCDVNGFMALIRRETTSDYAKSRKLKERFEFAVLMQKPSPDSARLGVTTDQVVRSDQMLETYH